MIRVNFRVDTSILDRGLRNILPNISADLDSLTNDVVTYLHQNWSKSSPSDPGNPPAIVTGALDKSVRKESSGRDIRGRFASKENSVAWFIRVGDGTAWYAADLQEGRDSTNLAPRPYIDPALESIEDKVPDGLKLSFKRSFI